MGDIESYYQQRQHRSQPNFSTPKEGIERGVALTRALNPKFEANTKRLGNTNQAERSHEGSAEKDNKKAKRLLKNLTKIRGIC